MSGLSSALSTALSGLRANQASLAIISSNVANAQTPGYVSRDPTQVQVVSGDISNGVRVAGVNRQLDEFIQSQLRTETAGGTYATQISNILSQLQSIYGSPGAAGSLEASYTNFTAAVQALSSSSGSQSAQVNVLTMAQSLAQSLNATSRGIQTLRTNVEQDIGNSVNQANIAMKQIAELNRQLQTMPATDPAAAGLMDQRDAAIDQLSQLMDVKVVIDSNNKASVFTSSGIQLVSDQASTLEFDAQGDLNANLLWNEDPTKSGVGTLSIRLPNGGNIDMIANNGISSGRIAADLQLRDKTLVQAQAQIDQMAATLASALSDKTTSGTAATSGTQSGFDLDISKVLPGNSVNITYTDTVTNTQRQITILRVDDPSVLPLPNTATATANDTVIGVDFSGGMASIVSQLNAAFGSSNLQFSNPSGSTLRVLDNGFGSVSVNAASTTTTASVLANGNAELPMFTDQNLLYTGRIDATGSQQLGLAARITVNAALLADPSKLTIYNTSPATNAGDTTRSDFIYSQLTSATFTYFPQTGLGSTAAPFKATLTSYMQQFLSQQSNAATSAAQIQQGQDVVVSTLQEKFNSTASVNIDNEMANLIALQNTYAASAHVMSAVQSMMQTLLQIQT